MGKTKIDREINKKLHKILNQLINDPESAEFRKPVYYKALGLEDYKKIIKKPIDLNAVRRNLTKNLYESLEEILDDIQLVWNNCKLYNEQGSWIYLTAVKLETTFHDLCLESFPSTPLPNNKIPDKALLLQQLSEKPNKSKGNNPASANKETTKDINSEDDIPSSTVKNNNPNNTITSSGGVAAATGTNGIDNNKQPIQNQNIIAGPKKQLPFKFSKKTGMIKRADVAVTHVPFMKFANDKQKFDQLILTTKAVAKLTTAQQKQIIDIIEEFQPAVVNQEEQFKKGVDFHLISEFTFDLIQSYLAAIKGEEGAMEIETDDEDE